MSQIKKVFCANCGAGKVAQPEMHKCPVCGQMHEKGTYCVNTGKNIADFLRERKNEKSKKLKKEFEKVNEKILRTIRRWRKIIGFIIGFLGAACIFIGLFIFISFLETGDINLIINKLNETSVISSNTYVNIAVFGSLTLIVSLLLGFVGLIIGAGIGKKEKFLWKSFLEEKGIKPKELEV